MHLSSLLPRRLADAAQANARRKKAKADLEAYLRGPRHPHTRGFGEYRSQSLQAAIADESLLRAFRRLTPLPKGFGNGLDERIVEYPWLFSRLTHEAGRLLDAGAILNKPLVQGHPALENRDVHIMTLAPESHCFWKNGISYIFGDLRDIPMRSDLYDFVVNVSTLEHIGMDNAFYTGDSKSSERAAETFTDAVREMARVLKSGGRYLFTVPFGRPQDFGWFRQFDHDLLAAAVDAFGPASSKEISYFQYSSEAWQISEETLCADSEYAEYISSPRAEWAEAVRRQPDRAGGARAVACVALTKA